ncbi:MAG TPA: C1 family peptidase [Ohtaekwangia sp.]|uniref:C1 family peptidase n=1 Tax=Ohtaekwangia sp. TaxID=2066019 RepID=UPI002F955454
MTAKKNPHAKRVLNIVPSIDVYKDWNIATAMNSNVFKAAKLPASIDLREDWWKINDQGSTGSCVGWALADSVLRWHFVNAGKLPKNKLLSVRFIWMASKEEDEFTSRPTTFIEEAGTSLKSALDVTRKFGCVEDDDLSFANGKLTQDDEDVFYSKASAYKIRSYYNLQTGDPLENWKKWLASNGPVFTALDVDDTWYNAKKTKGNLAKYTTQHYGGHAVAIVGYTKKYFIVRNSWGTSEWGDKGFGYASYAYARAAFQESYGVSIF